jgi:polyribonucleotide 5'-hydroxyl-kinase
MPGTITATSISHIIDVEEGFGSTATTGASMGSTIMPLAYYYGYQNPAENVQLYKLLVSKLAQGVKARSAIDDETRIGGQIIDTTGLIDQVGYDIIRHAIEQFSGRCSHLSWMRNVSDYSALEISQCRGGFRS